MPTIATVQVFDFETFSGDPVNANPSNASGALITATLNYNQVNAISPQANLQAVRVQTLTDTTGRWQLNLIPNGNINPANTLWTISTPTQNYQISVPASGPVQSSSVKVASPVTLSPASSTSGPLTVAGALTVAGLLAAQAGETVAGGLTVTSGALAVQAGALTLSRDLRRSAQSIAYAASITPDATLGEVVTVGTLTANITVNNPINAFAGQVLTFIFTQDATGGRTVTWGAAFRTGWQLVGGFGNVTQAVSFIYDGTNWQLISGPSIDSGVHVRATTLAVDNNLSVFGAAGLGQTTVGAHLLATGTAPTLGALQTNITAQSVTGNDIRGVVSVTTSATPPGIGAVVAIVTFASAYATAPIVVLTDQGTGADGEVWNARSVTTTGFTIKNSNGGTALGASTTYGIGYMVIG